MNSTPLGGEGADAAFSMQFSMQKQSGALPPFETESTVQAQLLYYQRLAAEQQLAMQEQIEVQRRQALELELLSRSQLLMSSRDGATSVISSTAQCDNPHQQDALHLNMSRLSLTGLALPMSGAHVNGNLSGSQLLALSVAPVAEIPYPSQFQESPLSSPGVQSVGVQPSHTLPLPQELDVGSPPPPPSPPPPSLHSQHQQQEQRPISTNISVPMQPMPQMAHQQVGLGQGLGSGFASSIPEADIVGSPSAPHMRQESTSPSQWGRSSQVAQMSADPHVYDATPRVEFSRPHLRQAPDAAQMRAFDPNVMAQAAAYTSQNLGHPQPANMRRMWGSSLPPLGHQIPTGSAEPSLPPNLLQNPVVYAEQLRILTATFEAGLMAPLGGGQATTAMHAQALSMAQQHLQQQIVAQQLAAQQVALQLLRAQERPGLPTAGEIHPSSGTSMAAMQLRGDPGSVGGGSDAFPVSDRAPLPLPMMSSFSQLLSHRSNVGSEIQSAGSSATAMSLPASASMPSPKKVRIPHSPSKSYEVMQNAWRWGAIKRYK